MAVFKHYHHHFHLSYTTSLSRHLMAIGLVLLLLSGVFLYVFHITSPSSTINLDQLSFLILGAAALNTFYRLLFAYFISLILSVPLALLITSNAKLEKFLLPIFDVVQSIPVLAFFPIIVLFFLRFNFFEGAAVFVIILDMIWNLVFTMVGGLKTIPQDIKSAAVVFRANEIKKLINVTLPSIFPFIITGSMLAWGQGWNIVIVAEVLHTYIPNINYSSDLLGLGSLLVNATSSGKNSVFLAAMLIMIIIIALTNLFIWQKLLRLTERYKYD